MSLQVLFVMTSAFFGMLTPFSENMDMTVQNMTISAKKCQLGRFLQTIRKRSSIQTLEDAIKPGNFMELIEAVKETAGFDKDKNCYKTPSLALKIGHSLLKVSDIIHCHALMAGDDNFIKSSKAFQKLYNAKRSEYISHCALNTMT